jgi:methionyl-tRNA synthetase
VVRQLGILIAPFVPDAATAILDAVSLSSTAAISWLDNVASTHVTKPPARFP